MRDAARDLAGLARRYGRDGLHFIAAGALDSTSELRRRIQQNNYGIGLRSVQAVDTLRVTRRPAGFRGKELPVGRGFIVKSGIPTMIQVATPYEGMGVTVTGTELEDEEEKMPRRWINGWRRFKRNIQTRRLNGLNHCLMLLALMEKRPLPPKPNPILICCDESFTSRPMAMLTR